MSLGAFCVRCVCALVLLLGLLQNATAHPLKLSLCEIEYVAAEKRLTIDLRLFLTDVNEALVFDPDSTELAFATPNEAEHAERLLMEYLGDFFSVKANGVALELEIKSKKLKGEGINTALGLVFEHTLEPPLTSLEIQNAVFTDLFFDQSNIVYVHLNGNSRSIMLNKKTPTHTLNF